MATFMADAGGSVFWKSNGVSLEDNARMDVYVQMVWRRRVQFVASNTGDI